LKLLEITRSYFPSIGGLEQFVYNRTKIYEDLGIDYKIISTDFSTPKQNPAYESKNTIFLKQYTRYNITPALFKHLSDTYNIISINQVGRFFSDYSIWRYAGTKAKVILTPHFSFHTKKYSLIKNFINHAVIKPLLGKVNAIICFTEYEAKFWINNFGVRPEIVKVIPHYINIEEKRITDYNDKKFFLYMGNYEKNKRIDLLVDAFNELRHDDYSLFITLNKDMIEKSVYERIILNPNIKLL
jgi:glycosyltransferase involved in cell wall biosynthesis